VPYIISARPEDLDRGPGAAVAGLGRGVSKLAAALDEVGKERERAKLADRKMKVEEQRAATALAREERALALQDAKAAEREADVAGSVEGIGQAGGQATADTFLAEALQSPGGVLGPFGALNPRSVARGTQMAGEVQERSARRMALAERMSPEGARNFLRQGAEEDKKAVRAKSAQEEVMALQDAVAEGVLGEQEAASYARALQSAIREGRPAGEIHSRLAQRYAMASKLKVRAEDWGAADKKASAMMQSLMQLADTTEGLDPETGKDIMSELVKRLADARGEWARTQYPSFRSKTDAAASLAGLQKILLGARADADPAKFLQQEHLDDFLPKDYGPGARDVVPGEKPRRVARPKSDRGVAGELKARGKTYKAGTVRPLTDENDARLLQEMVLRESATTLAAGGDRKARVVALRDKIAHDLGLDPTDPQVFSVVQSALQQAYGR